jgi:hypothetical protein
MKLFNNAARRTLVPDPLNNRFILALLELSARPSRLFFAGNDLPGLERRAYCAVEPSLHRRFSMARIGQETKP